MAYQTLIQVDELRQHLGDAGFVIFDCRHDLMKPDAGAQAYAQSHIPGARFAHSDKHLSGPKTGKTGRHPLPEPGQFMAWLGANGVDASTQVIAYDYAGGASATRLWWMLRWLGHDDVAVLDGGWEAWAKAGAPVSADLPVVIPKTFDGRARDVAVDVRLRPLASEHARRWRSSTLAHPSAIAVKPSRSTPSLAAFPAP